MLRQVLFSSVAALLGSPGQASYAAANSSMDFLPSAWRRGGSPTTAIQWGPWADIGMAAGRPELAIRADRSGLCMLTPEQGLAALGGVLESRPPAAASGVVVAAPISWRRFLQHRARRDTSKDANMFAEFTEDNSRPVATAGGKLPVTMSVSPAEDVGGLESALSSVKVLVRAAVSSVLRSEVSNSQPLMAAGACGSLTVQLNQNITHARLTCPATYCTQAQPSCDAALHLIRLVVVGWCTNVLFCCSGRLHQVSRPPEVRCMARSVAASCSRSRLAQLGGAAQRTGGRDGLQPARHARLRLPHY